MGGGAGEQGGDGGSALTLISGEALQEERDRINGGKDLQGVWGGDEDALGPNLSSGKELFMEQSGKKFGTIPAFYFGAG